MDEGHYCSVHTRTRLGLFGLCPACEREDKKHREKIAVRERAIEAANQRHREAEDRAESAAKAREACEAARAAEASQRSARAFARGRSRDERERADRLHRQLRLGLREFPPDERERWRTLNSEVEAEQARLNALAEELEALRAEKLRFVQGTHTRLHQFVWSETDKFVSAVREERPINGPAPETPTGLAVCQSKPLEVLRVALDFQESLAESVTGLARQVGVLSERCAVGIELYQRVAAMQTRIQVGATVASVAFVAAAVSMPSCLLGALLFAAFAGWMHILRVSGSERYRRELVEAFDAWISDRESALSRVTSQSPLAFPGQDIVGAMPLPPRNSQRSKEAPAALRLEEALLSRGLCWHLATVLNCSNSAIGTELRELSAKVERSEARRSDLEMRRSESRHRLEALERDLAIRREMIAAVGREIEDGVRIASARPVGP